MVLKTRFGNRSTERRLFENVDVVPRPGSAGAFGTWTYPGRWVTPDAAIGLPVVMAAIRILAETVGLLEIDVVTKQEGVYSLQSDAEQLPLLQHEPNSNQTPFEFKAYITACLQGWSGAYLLKNKNILTGKPLELLPLPPERCTPKLTGQDLVFKVRDENGAMHTLSRQDILYIPSILFLSPYIGQSPIEIHRQAIGSMEALEEFQGRFYSNDASPGGIIETPQQLSEEKRRELRESWEARHGGVSNSHRVSIMWGGATYKQVSINPKDAEYVASRQLSVQEASRIFRVPAALLGHYESRVEATTPAQTDLHFVKYSLSPWLRRIEDALHRDRDVFPDPSLKPVFMTTDLLRLDAFTQAEADLRLRQAGLATVNELRPHYGLPPHVDGDTLQATPVGGAPNPSAPSKPAPVVDDNQSQSDDSQSQ